jgi:hypothetical protein
LHLLALAVSEAAPLAARAFPVAGGVVLADPGLVQLGVVHLFYFVVGFIAVRARCAGDLGA